MTTDEIQSEINGLKNLLEQTDYKVWRAVECIFSATTATALISAIKEAAETVSEVIESRKAWRERINELEAMEPDDAEATSDASDAAAEEPKASDATEEASE